MKKTGGAHTIDIIFILVLFCVFAVSVLMVLLTGAGAYKDIAQLMENHYEERTVLSYLEAKVHHYDRDGAIQVVDYQGSDALAMAEEIDGRQYITLVYFYDGAVRELFYEAGIVLEPEAGQLIMAAQDFQANQLSDDFIHLTCTGASGEKNELFLSIRSEEVEDHGQA